MFVQIISSFCFIIFRINSSIPVWTRSGRWQKDRWAARTSQCAWSSAGVEKSPWENTQMAEAARYHEIGGELFSFWTPQKGRGSSVPNVLDVDSILEGGNIKLAGHLVQCLSITDQFVTDFSREGWGLSECRLWAVLSLMSNPCACSALNYVLGLMCWVLNYASVVQILIWMIFYIPKAHVIC